MFKKLRKIAALACGAALALCLTPALALADEIEAEGAEVETEAIASDGEYTANLMGSPASVEVGKTFSLTWNMVANTTDSLVACGEINITYDASKVSLGSTNIKGIQSETNYSYLFNDDGKGSAHLSFYTKTDKVAPVKSLNVATLTFTAKAAGSANIKITNGVAGASGQVGDKNIKVGNVAAVNVVAPAKYTVTFNANGGKVSETSRQVEAGKSIGTLPVPTRSGYTFKCWTASDDMVITAKHQVHNNMTLYAQWTKNSNPTGTKATVYRLYNPYVPGGDHHYTTDKGEHDYLVSVGWKSESTSDNIYQVYADQVAGTVPVYREYNPYAQTGTHNWTTDKKEHESLIAAGWKNEGVAWYSTTSATGDFQTPVYRLYNQYTGEHFYCRSLNEYKSVISSGWNGESEKSVPSTNNASTAKGDKPCWYGLK